MLADRTSLVVLVVEDEWLVRHDIVSKFKARGWLVLEAGDAKAAIDLFRGARIDLLFTDIQLGGALSGWDVAETFRAELPSLEVAYTSARCPDSSRQVPRGVF